MYFTFSFACTRRYHMSVISVERGLLGYLYPSRLPHQQEGFTLWVEDPTLRFELDISNNLSALNGSYGITRIELHNHFLYVHLDLNDEAADYDLAVGLMVTSSKEYLEWYAI